MRKPTTVILSILVNFQALICFTPALFAESIGVMSYNIHRGGIIHKKQPLSQTAKGIQLAKADIVGIQETRSPRGDTLKDLAELLGWNHDEGSGIVTRYEILENFKGGIKVKLASDKHAYIFNLHLPSHPYQPYQLLEIRPKWHKHTNNITFIKTEAETIEWAKKARGKEVAKLLNKIKSLPDKEAPVFVVGDFNEPSHLDWTEAAAKAGRHPIKVAYPTSTEMAKAGFRDSYRTIYPDEMKNPGITWSPAYKVGDPRTHHDRIDFVYFKGKGLEVKEVKILGENEENADLVVSPYPSDHRAVVATFTLIDGEYPAPACDPIKLSEGR
jgi:exodeoxyribonuclease-3